MRERAGRAGSSRSELVLEGGLFGLAGEGVMLFGLRKVTVLVGEVATTNFCLFFYAAFAAHVGDCVGEGGVEGVTWVGGVRVDHVSELTRQLEPGEESSWLIGVLCHRGSAVTGAGIEGYCVVLLRRDGSRYVARGG